jgi:hypothetical protein
LRGARPPHAGGTGVPTLKIFISHGAGQDESVAAALELIVPRLHERGYDVFTDVEKLRVGDEWHPVLYEEMYLCDAAIVLLGPETIKKSDWVRREADVLMGRHIVRSLRTVLPVFLGTQDTREARNRGFNALLNLQAELGKRETNPLPEGDDIECFTDWIVAEFAPLVGTVCDRPFHVWAKRISDYLTSAYKQNSDTVTEAAKMLCCDQDEMLHVRAKVGAELFLAHLLLRTGESVRSGSADSPLPAAVAALRPGLAGSQLNQLAQETLPGWVDPEDAVPFAPRRSGGPDGPDGRGGPKPVVLLSAYDEWTAEQHIKRSLHNEPDSYSLGDLPPQDQDDDMPADGRPPTEDLLALCRVALRGVFGLPPRKPLNADEVRPVERRREYLVINTLDYALPTVATAVNTLHEEFPWLIVVVLVPDGLPDQDQLRRLGLSRAVPVDLSGAVESRAYSLKERLDEVVGSTS